MSPDWAVCVAFAGGLALGLLMGYGNGRYGRRPDQTSYIGCTGDGVRPDPLPPLPKSFSGTTKGAVRASVDEAFVAESQRLMRQQLRMMDDVIREVRQRG